MTYHANIYNAYLIPYVVLHNFREFSYCYTPITRSEMQFNSYDYKCEINSSLRLTYISELISYFLIIGVTRLLRNNTIDDIFMKQ